MKYSNWGAENPDSFKFCGQCSAKQEVKNKCHKCDTTLINDAIFCHKCGTRVCVEPIDIDNVSRIDTCHKELEFVVGTCF